MFKYLGRFIRDDDNDEEAIRNNVTKARRLWTRLKVALSRENATYRTMGYFYKAVIMSVMLFGSESWTLNTQQMIAIRAFHRNVAMGITRKFPKKVGVIMTPTGIEEQWEHPKTDEMLEMCGLERIETYIARRKETMLHWVNEELPDLYEQCQLSKNNPMCRGHITWWNDNDNDQLQQDVDDDNSNSNSNSISNNNNGN